VTSRTALPFLLLLALLPAPGAARDDLPPEVAEVRDCAERNFPAQSARQKLVLERSVEGADARRLEATLLWKRGEDGLARVRVTVDAPQAERGTAFLLIEREGEDEMFSYLPEFRKVRRITSRSVNGSFLGSDLSYEDFQELRGLSEHARVERLPDETVRGRASYVLVGTPEAGSGSRYERVRSFIDRETCVLLRAELTGAGVDRVAEVAFADVERVGERWVPKRLVLHDRANGSETRVSILETEWDTELPDRLFTQTELGKGR
jgi:outer membrane lipoprotein-sorting protein